MSSHAFAGLGFDPAPGDLETGRSMVARLRRATDALREIEYVSAGGAGTAWIGQSATAFHDLVDDELFPRIKIARASFERATDGLSTWLVRLAEHQHRARDLEARAAHTRNRIRSLRDQVAAVPRGPFTDPTLAIDHERRRRELQQLLSNEQQLLNWILDQAHDLAQEATSAARGAAGHLEQARDMAPHKPGIFKRIGNALEGIGEFIGDVLDYIKHNWWDLLHQIVNIAATVLAVASLFVPVLAPFALGLAIANVAMSGIDWARGVPGAKEAFLIGAVGLVGGAVLGKAIGTLTRNLEPIVLQGPFTAVVNGGGVGAMAMASPIVLSLAYNPQFGPALMGYMGARYIEAKDNSDNLLDAVLGHPYYQANLANGWREARAR